MKIDPRNLFGALPAAATGGDPVKAAIYPAAAVASLYAMPGIIGAGSAGAGAAGAGAQGAGWGSLLKTTGASSAAMAGMQAAMPQYGMTTPMTPGQLTPMSPIFDMQQLMRRF